MYKNGMKFNGEATILSFPAKGHLAERKHIEKHHAHGANCLCVSCRNGRQILDDLKNNPMPTSGDELVRLYNKSLMEGLENWAGNPQRGSMFEAIKGQFMKDGIVK